MQRLYFVVYTTSYLQANEFEAFYHDQEGLVTKTQYRYLKSK